MAEPREPNPARAMISASPAEQRDMISPNSYSRSGYANLQSPIGCDSNRSMRSSARRTCSGVGGGGGGSASSSPSPSPSPSEEVLFAEDEKESTSSLRAETQTDLFVAVVDGRPVSGSVDGHSIPPWGAGTASTAEALIFAGVGMMYCCHIGKSSGLG